MITTEKYRVTQQGNGAIEVCVLESNDILMRTKETFDVALRRLVEGTL